MSKPYEDMSLEALRAHCLEGWALANTRTRQLREAVQALKGAEHVIICWARPMEKDYTANVNLQEMMKVLEWGRKMFPDPEDSLHEVAAEEDERLGDMAKDGEA